MTTHSPRRSVDPVRLLVDMNLAAKVWFGLFVLSLLTQIATPVWQFFTRATTVERFIVIDGQGVTRSGYVTALTQATNVQLRTAEDATRALLDRQPNDFDRPQLVAELFLPGAFAKAREWAEQERPERVARMLHQKAEPSRYQLAKLNDERVLATVSGQLVLAGSVGGQPLADSAKFTLELQLVPNPDLANNARTPLVVSNFRYELFPH